LRAYTSLLGEERALEEIALMADRFSILRVSPASTKHAVASAFTAVRGGKDFGSKP
jgi:hypothetical protein